MEELPTDILFIFVSLLNYNDNCKFALSLPRFYIIAKPIIEKIRPIHIKSFEYAPTFKIIEISELQNNLINKVKLEIANEHGNIKIYFNIIRPKWKFNI